MDGHIPGQYDPNSTPECCRATQTEVDLDLVHEGRHVAVRHEPLHLPDGRSDGQDGIGRITVVNHLGDTVLDTFVYYPDGVLTEPPQVMHRFGTDAIRPQYIRQENGARPMSEILTELDAIFTKSGTIVTYWIEDLQSRLPTLQWDNWQFRDIKLYDAFVKNWMSGNKPSLPALIWNSLKRRPTNIVEETRCLNEIYKKNDYGIDWQQQPKHFQTEHRWIKDDNFVDGGVPQYSLIQQRLEAARERDEQARKAEAIAQEREAFRQEQARKAETIAQEREAFRQERKRLAMARAQEQERIRVASMPYDATRVNETEWPSLGGPKSNG